MDNWWDTEKHVMIDWLDYGVEGSQREEPAQGQAGAVEPSVPNVAPSDPAAANNATDEPAAAANDTATATGAQQTLPEAAVDEPAAASVIAPPSPPPPSPPAPAAAAAPAPAPKTRKRKATEAVAPRQKIPRAAKNKEVNYKS